MQNSNFRFTGRHIQDQSYKRVTEHSWKKERKANTQTDVISSDGKEELKDSEKLRKANRTESVNFEKKEMFRKKRKANPHTDVKRFDRKEELTLKTVKSEKSKVFRIYEPREQRNV